MKTTGVMLLSLRVLRIQQTFIFSLNFSFYNFAQWSLMHENTGAVVKKTLVNLKAKHKKIFLGMDPTTAARPGH